MPRCFSFALLVSGFLLGCGGEPAAVVPPLQSVTGTVLWDGQPAERVVVSFNPTGQTGNAGYGSTDASGNFTITYQNNEPGVPEGEYIVLFSKMTQADGTPIPEGKTAADVMAVDQVPMQYRTTERPVYAVTVPSGGKKFDFEIKGK